MKANEVKSRKDPKDTHLKSSEPLQQNTLFLIKHVWCSIVLNTSAFKNIWDKDDSTENSKCVLEIYLCVFAYWPPDVHAEMKESTRVMCKSILNDITSLQSWSESEIRCSIPS